ncbi:hypothetical protein ACLESO_17715 [Pyxidicoccus sp. 3LG]
MRLKTPVLSLLTSALLATTAALGDDRQDNPDHYASGDLDGDGKPEDISASWDPMAGEFTLTVGKATATADNGNTEHGKVSIIDIDTRDKWKEVAVATGMFDEVHLYRYDGAKLIPLGVVRTLEEVRGDGVLVSSAWRGFWNRRDSHTLDPKTGKLTSVTPELFYVGAEATVKQSFPITLTAKSKQAVANLAPGSKIQVLAASQADQKGWYYYYLVKSSSGLLGWSTGDILMKKTEGLPQPPKKAGED